MQQAVDILKNKYNPSGRKTAGTLTNVVEAILRDTPRADIFSCWWDKNNNCVLQPGELSLIDHILVSEGLRNRITNVRFYHDFPAGCNFYSDHWPVVVEIDTR